MAWERENACVGCAECINCGRKFSHYWVCYCDECGDVIEGTGIHHDGRQLCTWCGADIFLREKVDEKCIPKVVEIMNLNGMDERNLEDLYEFFHIEAKDQYTTFDAEGERD